MSLLPPLFALLAPGCTLTPEAASERIEASFRAEVDGETVRNGVLHVDAPHLGVSGTWAEGVADEADDTAMTPSTPFLSASVGKIFVAATAFDLAGDGVLDLDDPVSKWIAAPALHGLPAWGGDSGFDRITLKMLLANRSGLPDYFEAPPDQEGAEGMLDRWLAEPDRAWTRRDLLDYARENTTAAGTPGEVFVYSDLNWDLLGLAIEGATGRPYEAVVRERVIDHLGLEHTWYYNVEPKPPGVPRHADVWFGDVNLARAKSITGDQAGGGLATTTGDLAKLLRGLDRGNPVSLDRLGTDWTEDAMSRGLDYGHGTWRWRPGRLSFVMSGLPELRGVSGSTNSFAYLTSDGTVIAGTFNQSDPESRHVRFVLSNVLPTLMRVRHQP